MTLQSTSQTKAEQRRSAIHFPFRKEGKTSYCGEEVEGKGEGADISARPACKIQADQEKAGREEAIEHRGT